MYSANIQAHLKLAEAKDFFRKDTNGNQVPRNMMFCVVHNGVTPDFRYFDTLSSAELKTFWELVDREHVWVVNPLPKNPKPLEL